MDRAELRAHAAAQLGCEESELIWSDLCRNPLTNYHHEDGTIKGSEGYWVLRL